MNRSLLLVALSCLSTAATAAIPTVEVGPASLTVACADPQLPRQAEVGRVLGINNAGETYAARSRLMVSVRQACKGGQSHLLVRRDAATDRIVVLAIR